MGSIGDVTEEEDEKIEGATDILIVIFASDEIRPRMGFVGKPY